MNWARQSCCPAWRNSFCSWSPSPPSESSSSMSFERSRSIDRGPHSLDPEGGHVDPVVGGAPLLERDREFAQPHGPDDRSQVWQGAVGEEVQDAFDIDLSGRRPVPPL